MNPTDMLLCADFFGSDEVAADAHCDDSLYLWFLGTEPEYEGMIRLLPVVCVLPIVICNFKM